ncbi:MAG: CDP-diacylglycerol--serine O-phosphatidyltransferase [Candidatus Solibacter usitatus]|nr:CDP-diacylglycerol--serine O-phosphatidyltransferase [Candidatus Solibacter usitatus]
MAGLKLQRWIEPQSPDRRPPRAAYALPTLFTAGNLFLGFLSVMRTIQGSILASTGAPGAEQHYAFAAATIGVAVLLDGLDGRIARMTNTTSDFGREMDSLADVISFGIAPAVLAFAWGVQSVDPVIGVGLRKQILSAGHFVAFLFLLCGSARLARFNVQKNPVPKNPGRPNRKYFVGLPIPAGAAMVAAVVYSNSEPVTNWMWTVAWIGLLALLSFLMVSTWRYYSFKDVSLLRPRSPLTVILLGIVIYLFWHYSQLGLLAMAIVYVGSGVVIRIGGIVRRLFRPTPPPPPEPTVA